MLSNDRAKKVTDNYGRDFLNDRHLDEITCQILLNGAGGGRDLALGSTRKTITSLFTIFHCLYCVVLLKISR